MRPRGRLNSPVSPVSGSMLTTMIVSVRIPTRPGPASPPSNKRLRRSLPSHSLGGTVVVVVGAVVVLGTGVEEGSELVVGGGRVVVVEVATATRSSSSTSEKMVVMRSYWSTS